MTIFFRGIMSAEIEEFKMEIMETIDRAERALLEFDQLPENQSSNTLYDEVFRAYHNIKGAAGMMEWNELQHHVHQLENILMQSKETASIPKHLIGWFLKGNDVTRSIMANEPYEFSYDTDQLNPFVEGASLQNAKTEKTSTDHSIHCSSEIEELPEEFFPEVNEALDRISSTLINMEAGKGDKDQLDALYRDIHSVKGAVQLFNLEGASILAHAMENSLEGARGKEQFEIDKALVSTLLLSVDLMLSCVREPKSEENLKEVSFMTNLLSPFSQPMEEKVMKPDFIEKESDKEIEKDFEKETPAHKSPRPVVLASKSQEPEKADTTIRVQVSLLDRLMMLMGEMVLVRNQVLQYSNKTDDLEFLNLSQKLDVVTSELQEETMKTRMQPIGNVLNKFQRVVRDLSGNLNKKINLNLFGVETELDKTLIEAVKDPLTHIVRNACDHGIESPGERMKKGKSETGTITIKACHEGGQVIVEITDDGKGLSREKILKKALERGIVEHTRVETMTDREVQTLIFSPGFSTAEKVTNVSGRGVGMDVVKSNIEKIGGFVDISSTEGEGTKITLKIPLTLAIVPAMIVTSQNDRFAIPQVKLVELVRIEKNNIEYLQGRPVYRLRGNILPLIDLKEVLAKTETSISDEAINIVVLNSDSHVFGLIVDEILDTADIVVKPLARFLKSIMIYSGATVLGDGSVAFILDVQGIAQKHIGISTHELKTVSDKYAEFVNGQLEMREFVLLSLSSKTKHAIPLSSVSRMEEVKTSSIEVSGHQRVIRYRGGILKLINLNKILGYTDSMVEKEITQVIVIKHHDTFFGLEVDHIIDVLSTRDHLDESLSDHEAILGNLITSDEIIVVLDIDKVCRHSHPRKHSPVDFNFSQKSLGKILLVEDTETIRHKVAQSLMESGFDVEVSIDGIDGLRKIAEKKCDFDLIVSDIEMPRMNGIEFARKVRSISSLKNIPMIAFTAKSTPADVEEAKSAGFNSFLEKSKGKLLPMLISESLSMTSRRSA